MWKVLPGKKKYSVETDPEMAEMMELADKDIRIPIILCAST